MRKIVRICSALAFIAGVVGLGGSFVGAKLRRCRAAPFLAARGAVAGHRDVAQSDDAGP